MTREDEAAKKAEAARKKAERDALLAEEEKNTPGRSAPKNAKAAQKKFKGLDLSGFDDDTSDAPLAALNASGINNALEALEITGDNKAKIDRHPERRVNAAFKTYWKSMEEKLTAEGFFKLQGNNKLKTRDKAWGEFLKSPENPLNQVHGTYDMTQEDIAEIRAQEKAKAEKRLAEK